MARDLLWVRGWSVPGWGLRYCATQWASFILGLGTAGLIDHNLGLLVRSLIGVDLVLVLHPGGLAGLITVPLRVVRGCNLYGFPVVFAKAKDRPSLLQSIDVLVLSFSGYLAPLSWGFPTFKQPYSNQSCSFLYARGHRPGGRRPIFHFKVGRRASWSIVCVVDFRGVLSHDLTGPPFLLGPKPHAGEICT